jgi:hypothetical protein
MRECEACQRLRGVDYIGGARAMWYAFWSFQVTAAEFAEMWERQRLDKTVTELEASKRRAMLAVELPRGFVVG